MSGLDTILDNSLIPAQVRACGIAQHGAQIALDLGILANVRHGDAYAEAVLEQVGEIRKALDLIEAAVAKHSERSA